MDVFFFGGLAITGFAAGLMGALLGLGGGVFVVPALSLIFQMPFLTAVGASNVAVVATSTAGASSYVRSGLANIRLGLVLLISTTSAALVSSLLASYLPGWVLRILFTSILVYVAITMLRRHNPQTAHIERTAVAAEVAEDIEPRAGDGGLHGSYHDAATGTVEHYRPRNVRAGIAVSALAGVIAGLLGVGGGVIQVPVMHLMMGVPLKVAVGTSNFMLGVTATSAAFVRYAHGDIDPVVAVPTALFVFLGARVGAWLVPRISNARLRVIFGWIALLTAVLMVLQALGIISTAEG
jgi:uncharacterized membrane protein YfcA